VATDAAAFYRKLLRMQVWEILHFLGVAEIGREDLARSQLRSISARFDRALDLLTRTSRRDRALVWLDKTVRELALGLRGRAIEPGVLELDAADVITLIREAGVDVTIGLATIKGLLEVPGDHDHTFAAETLVRLPWFDRPIGPHQVDLIQAYCLSLMRPPRRGRRRRGEGTRRTRWDLFHELAVDLKLWSASQGIEELKRTVRRARRSLRLRTVPTAEKG
jgi:hypothetical protein